MLRRVVTITILLGALTSASSAMAHGRKFVGDHPYHVGYYAVPPVSAYEAVRVRPPMRYGAPMYYYPESYLPAGMGGQIPAWYPGVPAERSAYYYISGYGQMRVYPW